MSWRDEITLRLPSPNEEEPRELRREILDEIEDHLECAMQRELRREDNVEAARKRVLKRFGDPTKLARRLWLDAMKGQLMNQRIMFGTNLVMLVLVLAMFVVLVVMLRHHQQFQQSMLDRIAGLAAAPEERSAEMTADHNWPHLQLTVVDEPGNEPRSGFFAKISGDLYGRDQRTELTGTTDENGQVTFGPMRPGRYSLNVESDDGLLHVRNVTVPPGQLHHKQIEWYRHEPEPIEFSVEIDWPEELLEYEPVIVLNLRGELAVEHTEGSWHLSDHISLCIAADGRVALLPTTTFHQLMVRETRDSRAVGWIDSNAIPWSETVTLDKTIYYQVARDPVHARGGITATVYSSRMKNDTNMYGYALIGRGYPSLNLPFADRPSLPPERVQISIDAEHVEVIQDRFDRGAFVFPRRGRP